MKTTGEFENRLKKARTPEQLEQVLRELPDMTFPVRLGQLCDQYGMTLSRVQIASGITKSLFYAIANGTRKPQRVQIIKLSLAIGLTAAQLNELLKLAGLKELYAKNKADAILIFGIENKLDLSDMEQLLTDAGTSLHLLDK